MPLHDWADVPDWESVHQLWIVELYKSIKGKLPAGYRAGLATVPALTVGASAVHPEVNVRQHLFPAPVDTSSTEEAADWQPDTELTLLTLDRTAIVQVTQQGRLVAVVELVSPRNKDRPETRLATQDRYVGYLALGVHLLLVDVHRHPLKFSFADALAQALGFPREPCPAPLAVSYGVRDNGPRTGRLLGIWQRSLTVGQPLSAMPLPLTPDRTVTVELEQTYLTATADAYLT